MNHKVLIFAFFLASCSSVDDSRDSAVAICQDLCQENLDMNMIMDHGPCLSDRIINDWVCDVAHNPSTEADNDLANQCPAYRAGSASHFVEVDTECQLIRAR